MSKAKGLLLEESANSIEEYVKIVGGFVSRHKSENLVYFRGEKDYGKSALAPGIYRNKGLLEKEHELYREISRFNDSDFEKDKTTIDRLCRMQHFGCPTRMLDLSEDCFASLFFALDNKEINQKTFVYLFAIAKSKIRYYDSDTATIIANLAKLPLNKEGRGLHGDKSKRNLAQIAEGIIKSGKPVGKYNEEEFGFLLHEIRGDKPYMLSLINLGDIFSVQCVKTKLNNDRILMQKGAFLLFGLNINEVEKAIPLDGSYGKPNYWPEDKWDGTPIEEILRIEIGNDVSLENLENLGISKPYIYPNMEEIAKYLANEFVKP